MTRAKRLAVLVLAAVLGTAWFLGSRVAAYVHAPIAVDAPRVAIPKGAGLREISRILRETGVAPWELGTTLGFRLWGKPRGVQAGIYAFKKGARLLDVLSDLSAGRVDRVTVTFPEGLTIREMAKILEEADVTRASQFSAFCLSASSSELWGLPGDSLEGFLFPDTYRFPREIPPRAVVEVMIRRFRQVTSALEPQARAKGMDLASWVTLASVVEKETGVAAERPLVAAVFRNRLRLGMRLQSDPTVIYGIQDFDGNLRRADLARDTPYNTYVRSGLPKGPISNPGRASLEAVLRPAEAGYLYFVSRNDGTHLFSDNYGEHRKAVTRYQKARRS